MTGFLEYLVVNRSRTNTTGDTVQTALLGRVQSIAESSIGDVALNRTSGSNTSVTQEMKHAAQMFMALVSASTIPLIDLSGTEVDAAFVALGPPGTGGCGVWKDPDITALKGLSQNKQSRATEISTTINYNGVITASHVKHARSLP